MSEGEKPTYAVPLCLPSNFRVENGELEYDEGFTRDEIVPCEEGLELLENLNEPLIVISITGPARSGKSFFLSQLQGGVKFSIGHSRTSHTTGIWIAVCPKTVEREGKRCRIVLLDAEGTGAISTVDEGASDEWDTKVFTLCSLISSVLIYNSLKQPTRNDLQQLGFIAKFSDSICKKSEDGVNTVAREQFRRFAPGFVWLIRDAQFFPWTKTGAEYESTPDDDDDEEYEDDWNDYMIKKVLCESGGGGDDVIKAIKHTFKSFHAFGIPSPSNKPKICRKLDDPSVADKIGPFLSKIKQVASEVIQQSEIKRVHGDLLTGSRLAQLIRLYLEAINSETKYHSWGNIWNTVIKTQLQKALKVCLQEYTDILQDCELPCPTSDLKTKSDVICHEMLNKFQESTFDTDQKMKRPFVDELTNGMEDEFRKTKQLNDEKCKDFCRRTIARLMRIHLHPFQNDGNDVKYTYRNLLKAKETVVNEYNEKTAGYAFSSDIMGESRTSLPREIALCTEKILERAEANALLEYNEICEPITEETVLTEHDLENEHAKTVEEVKRTFIGFVDGNDDIEQLVAKLEQKLDKQLENRKIAISTKCHKYIDTLKSTYWLPRMNQLPKVPFQELLEARRNMLDNLHRKFGGVPGLKEQFDDLEAVLTEQLKQNVNAIVKWARDDSIERFTTAVQPIKERVPCVETDELEETCNDAKLVSIGHFTDLVEGCGTIGHDINNDQQRLERDLHENIESVKRCNKIKSSGFNTRLMNSLIEEFLVNKFHDEALMAATDRSRSDILRQYDERALGPTRLATRTQYSVTIENEIDRIRNRVHENRMNKCLDVGIKVASVAVGAIVARKGMGSITSVVP